MEKACTHTNGYYYVYQVDCFFVLLICDGDGGGDGGSNEKGWREMGFGDINYTFDED